MWEMLGLRDHGRFDGRIAADIIPDGILNSQLFFAANDVDAVVNLFKCTTDAASCIVTVDAGVSSLWEKS